MKNISSNDSFELEPTILPSLFKVDGSDTDTDFLEGVSDLDEESSSEETHETVNLQYILTNNETFILDALSRATTDEERDGVLAQLGDELKNNADFFIKHQISLKYADESLRQNKTVIQEAIARDPEEYDFIEESLYKDAEILEWMFLSIDKQDDSISMLLLKFKVMDHMLLFSKNLPQDAKYKQLSLAFLEKLLADELSVSAFLECYPNAYRNFPIELQKNPVYALTAFKYDNQLFAKLHETLKDDSKFMSAVLEIVQNNAEFFIRNHLSIQHASPKLRMNKQVIQAAIARDANEYFHIDESLYRDKEVIDWTIQAIETQGQSMDMSEVTCQLMEQILILQSIETSFVVNEITKRRKTFLQENLKFNIETFISNNPLRYQLLPFAHQQNTDIALQAFALNSNVSVHFQRWILENFDFVQELLVIDSQIEKSKLILHLKSSELIKLLDDHVISLDDIIAIPKRFEKDNDLLMAVLHRYKDNKQEIFMNLTNRLSDAIKDNQCALMYLIRINPAYCELASERLRNEEYFMLLACYINMDCLCYAGNKLKNDPNFQRTVCEMTNSYMLEVIAKITLSLGLTMFGIILLTQVASLPLVLISVASLVTGLCASGFFANEMFIFNQREYQNQKALDTICQSQHVS